MFDLQRPGAARRGLAATHRVRLPIGQAAQLRLVVLQQDPGQRDHQEEQQQPEHHPGHAPAHEVHERDGQRDEHQAAHGRASGVEGHRRRPVALQPLGEQGGGGGQRAAAHGDGAHPAKEQDEEQDVGGQGQEHGSHAEEDETDQDEPPPTQAVVQPPQAGRTEAADERAEGGSQRDGTALPAKCCTHGEDKAPEAAAGSHRHQGHTEGRGHDAPAVIDARTGWETAHTRTPFLSGVGDGDAAHRECSPRQHRRRHRAL